MMTRHGQLLVVMAPGNKKGWRQCSLATGQDDDGQLQADIGRGEMRQCPESQGAQESGSCTSNVPIVSKVCITFVGLGKCECWCTCRNWKPLKSEDRKHRRGKSGTKRKRSILGHHERSDSGSVYRPRMY